MLCACGQEDLGKYDWATAGPLIHSVTKCGDITIDEVEERLRQIRRVNIGDVVKVAVGERAYVGRLLK